jgi:hypothetical protein
MKKLGLLVGVVFLLFNSNASGGDDKSKRRVLELAGIYEVPHKRLHRRSKSYTGIEVTADTPKVISRSELKGHAVEEDTRYPDGEKEIGCCGVWLAAAVLSIPELVPCLGALLL